MSSNSLLKSDFSTFATIICDLCRKLHTSASTLVLSISLYADCISSDWQPNDSITCEIMAAASILLASKHNEDLVKSRDICIALVSLKVLRPESHRYSELVVGLVRNSQSEDTLYDQFRLLVGKAELILIRQLSFRLNPTNPFTMLAQKTATDEVSLNEFRQLYPLLLTCLADSDAHYVVRECESSKLLDILKTLSQILSTESRETTKSLAESVLEMTPEGPTILNAVFRCFLV
ncbi:hypothetical protein GEMRC1_002440 [Eukaryota sp. GEM-RC1]